MDPLSFKSNPIIARGEEDEYFSLAAKKSLHIQQCAECKSYIFYPRGACPDCLSLSLNWVKSNGTGEVFTFTIHYRYPEYLSDSDPYAIGIVQLDEGVRVLSRILGDPDKVFIGMRVRVVYIDTGEGGTIPAFVSEAEPL